MKIELDGATIHAATGGVDIAAAGSGDGPSRPVVLLVHGAGMDGTVWQNQTRFLAHRNLRAVAVDLPAHGRSEGEPLKSIADMADWTARFIEAAGLADRAGGIHVVGHSMGTFIGLELARRHRKLVRSLILLGTADAMPVHPELISSSENALEKASALMSAWSHGRSAHVGLNPVPGMWMLGGARALVENSRPGTLTADFAACADYTEAGPALVEVTTGADAPPVLIVVGREDKMTPPAGAKRLMAAVDDGDAVTSTMIPAVGHMMMTENPRAVREIILNAVQAVNV